MPSMRPILVLLGIVTVYAIGCTILAVAAIASK